MKSDPFRKDSRRLASLRIERRRRRLQRMGERRDAARRRKSQRFRERFLSGRLKNGDDLPLIDADVYLRVERKRVPPWILPMAATIFLVVLVFWLAPTVAARLGRLFGDPDGDGGTEISLLYGDRHRVVATTATDLFDAPDLKAGRISQLVLNEVVRVLDPPSGDDAYLRVRAADGTVGYVRTSTLAEDCRSAEPALHRFRIVIVDRMKRIMSHASSGTLLMEAMMGTELYGDVRGDGVYRVSLPDGRTGWVGQNGTVEIPLGQVMAPGTGRDFAISAMNFHNVTFLEGGLTQRGIDGSGIAWAAGRANGLALPRTLEAQKFHGTALVVERDPDTDRVRYDRFLEGDLLFFRDPLDNEKVSEIGIVTAYGQCLMARPQRSSVRLVNLAEDPLLASRLVEARRPVQGTSAGTPVPSDGTG